MNEINDYLSKADKDIAKNVMYRVYGIPGPLFMENEVTPTPGPEPEPSFNIPFYVENITNEDETLTIAGYDDTGEETPSYLEFPVEYSLDGTTWSSLGTTGETPLTMTLQPGEKVELRATTDFWYEYQEEPYIDHGCTITGVSKVGGNIMSLLYGSSFTGNETSFPNNTSKVFVTLFINSVNLRDASELILPVTTLTENCYESMFSGCESLTTAPVLPATTLTEACYIEMFSNCTTLTSVPTLPATMLAVDCYAGMFYGCTSMTWDDVPELPATTLADSCYYNMFFNISNTSFENYDEYDEWCANNIPEVADYDMSIHGQLFSITQSPEPDPDYTTPFYIKDISGSTNTVTFIKIDGSAPTITVEVSLDGTNWESIGSTSTTGITAEIPANGKLYVRSNASKWASSYEGRNSINVSGDCNLIGNLLSLLYGSDFVDQTTISAYNSFQGLFKDNQHIINANKLLMPTNTKDYCFSAMFNGCTSLVTAPSLPAETAAVYAYNYMFADCTSLSEPPIMLATVVNSGTCGSMFRNCTSLTTSPELLSTTLAIGSYSNMFNGCTSLTQIKCLATGISASDCLKDWVKNVGANGVFIKNASASSWTTGNSGIPSGWTVQDA